MNTPEINIGARKVGDGHSPFIIAEVGQAHDGSVGAAHAFIDVASHCGVDAIKFQTHLAESESSEEEPFRSDFSFVDSSRLSYWKRLQFDLPTWVELAEHANQAGLVFLSSAFSTEAAKWLSKLDVAAWKIGSGEIGHTALIAEMAREDKPFLLSTGMSGWDEISESVRIIKNLNRQLVLMQCTSEYPTPLEHVGLNVIVEMKKRFPDVPVGFSDHSGSIWPSIFAMSRGASVIEVHLTLHKLAFGPDTTSSLDPDQLTQLVQARNSLNHILHNSVDKDALAAHLSPLKKSFGRSVATVAAFKAEHILREEDLTLKKPGGGIPPGELLSLVGRRLARDVSPSRLLRKSDLAL